MRYWTIIDGYALVVLLAGAKAAQGADTFSERFGKGTYSFGMEAGFGFTFDLPPDEDRVDLKFALLFPNFEYNLTGVIGQDAWYEGALYWHTELNAAYLTNHGGNYLAGFSPIMFEYKFLDPKRSWAPNILGGAGFSFTNWDDVAYRELGSPFEFLLHIGAGLEFFQKEGSFSINYRLFHVSNSGIARPNIGVNAHVFTLGVKF